MSMGGKVEVLAVETVSVGRLQQGFRLASRFPRFARDPPSFP